MKAGAAISRLIKRICIYVCGCGCGCGWCKSGRPRTGWRGSCTYIGESICQAASETDQIECWLFLNRAPPPPSPSNNSHKSPHLATADFRVPEARYGAKAFIKQNRAKRSTPANSRRDLEYNRRRSGTRPAICRKRKKWDIGSSITSVPARL
jgi:hypothetical protein